MSDPLAPGPAIFHIEASKRRRIHQINRRRRRPNPLEPAQASQWEVFATTNFHFVRCSACQISPIWPHIIGSQWKWAESSQNLPSLGLGGSALPA